MINIGDVYEDMCGDQIEVIDITKSPDIVKFDYIFIKDNPYLPIINSEFTFPESVVRRFVTSGKYKLIRMRKPFKFNGSPTNIIRLTEFNWVDREDLPILDTHQNHEVVTNAVYGKTFNYCRDCKVEV